MKIAHWSLDNGSGLHKVAAEISAAEKKFGLDSEVYASTAETEFWEKSIDADVHVIHSHLPDKIRAKTKGKIVFIPHGTPEHSFQGAVEEYTHKGYGAGNSFMLLQYWIQEADATVTFWERHRDILQMFTHKKNEIHCVPFGVDKEFWKPVPSRGKLAGEPSLMSLENCHYIKWPLDLFLAWPKIAKTLFDARLHVLYLPTNQHRFWYPLLRATGCDYNAFTDSAYFGSEDVRNCFVSADYYIGLVRYGDFNRTCMEAKACGCKLISYAGNEYADYWLPEGNQREMARVLVEILKGGMEPRNPTPPHSIEETVEAMVEIYGSL